MLSSWTQTAAINSGYIAGTGGGIVSIDGKGAARRIYLLDAQTLQVLYVNHALNNGHYLLRGLDPSREYLLIARDHLRNYEPVAYDYVRPATDLTHVEQEELWQQMLSS